MIITTRRGRRCGSCSENGVLQESGFSLVELMIAMVLGLLVAEGIYILFAAAGKVNTTQTALARLQENGRIAIDLIASDLRLVGRLPCGSKSIPLVYTEALSSHLHGPSAEIRPLSSESRAGKPYLLDRDAFLGGSTCKAKSCYPTFVGVPQAGLGVGERVPGSEVLMVRYLQEDGLPVGASGQICDANGHVAGINAPSLPGSAVLNGLKSSHLVLLAGCKQAQIFQAKVTGSGVQPVPSALGSPVCSTADTQTQLFDLDEQLQTSIYYLQVTRDDKTPGRRIAALMRKTNGSANEIAQGVERLDFRYSLTDMGGNAHWLNADEVNRHVSAEGGVLQCGRTSAVWPCSWKDVNAVEISLLVDTVDDLPAEASEDAWDYRYSIDGEQVQRPTAAMPVTSLPAGRMLRREFRTVVALRGLSA